MAFYGRAQTGASLSVQFLLRCRERDRRCPSQPCLGQRRHVVARLLSLQAERHQRLGHLDGGRDPVDDPQLQPLQAWP